MGTDNDQRTLTLQDIPGALTYLKFRGISQITLKKQSDGRVVGIVAATPEIYQLLAEFQSNPQVSLTEFLACQRRLRGQMLDLRDADKNGQRK